MAYDWKSDWWNHGSLQKVEREERMGLPPGTHRCSSYKKVKPIEEFYARRETNYIRQPCKHCMGMHRAEKRALL